MNRLSELRQLPRRDASGFVLTARRRMDDAIGPGPAPRFVVQASLVVAKVVIFVTWQLIRVVVAALFALTEPLLRVTRVPLTFLGFVSTLLFGFLRHTPGYPRWGMLTLSVSLLLVYWLVLWTMSLFVHLPANHDR